MSIRVVNSVVLVIMCWVLLIGVFSTSYAQSRRQLRRQLNLATQMINEASKKENLSFEDYSLVREQIRLREELLLKLKGNIKSNKQEIERLDALICKMQEDLELLKNNYSKTAKQTYIFVDQNNFWLSLLSSGSLSEAYYRLLFYKQFSRYRQQQIQILQRSQKYLIEKSLTLHERQKEQEILVEEEKETANTLVDEKKTAEQMAASLKSRYEKYKSDIKKQRQLVKTTVNKNEKAWQAVYSSTKSEANLKSSFIERKGSLNWPVKRSRCIITGRFGKSEDAYGNPITNDGIYIRTQQSEPVSAVYSGTVTAVQNLPLGGKMVIVAHGDYRTTYSNLENVIVRKGDKLEAGQGIGTIHTDTRTGESILQFLIYKIPGTFVNPEIWLANYTRGE